MPVLDRRFGLPEACNALSFLELAGFLENLNALEALEHAAFTTQGGRSTETTML
jgi:hypothetical protein